MTSSSLLNNKSINKVSINNLKVNKNSNLLNLSKYYIGNFQIFELKIDGSFEINVSNNRIIETFTDLDNNILGYIYLGDLDETTNTIINEPANKISNIGYINISTNDNLSATIRASKDAGSGSLEEWIFNNDLSISSYYSINGNNGNNNNATIWKGIFKPYINIFTIP